MTIRELLLDHAEQQPIMQALRQMERHQETSYVEAVAMLNQALRAQGIDPEAPEAR